MLVDNLISTQNAGDIPFYDYQIAVFYPILLHIGTHIMVFNGRLEMLRWQYIIYGPIVVVHSSNNVSWRPPIPECENRLKGGVASHMTPYIFGR